MASKRKDDTVKRSEEIILKTMEDVIREAFV